MPITVVIGEQRGDEGKGRIVDMLAKDHDIVARFNGGPNAGHTVLLPSGQELDLHLIPSGISYKHTINVIGNGAYVDPVKLCLEIEDIRSHKIKVTPNNLKISSAAHLILPHHKFTDEIREHGREKQGSTKSGIAQVAADKYLRSGHQTQMIIDESEVLLRHSIEGLTKVNQLRVNAGLPKVNIDEEARIFIEAASKLKDFIADTVLLVNRTLQHNKRVLAEGAQAYLLDIDQGMYPYVTSSITTTAGVLTGLGVSYRYIDRVVGVIKATQSHVGGGPFPTEILSQSLLDRLRGQQGDVDAEFGTTTGRARRIGHLDLPQLLRAQMINGSQEICLTKLDCLPRYGKTVQICTKYKLDNREVDMAPASAKELERCQPVYTKLPTWDTDIQDIREFNKLPKNAQDYIRFIEIQTGLPVTAIGVGPRRDQVVIRK